MKTQQPTGIVASIDDPAKAGRIKCALAAVDGNVYPEWIEPVFTPGWISMPEVGDEVELIMPDGEDLVEFAHEIKYRGKVYDEAHPVPGSFQTNYPKRRGYYTKGGHLLVFDDQGGTINVTNGQTSTKVDMDGSGSIIITVTKLLKLGGSAAAQSVIKGEVFNTAHATTLGLLSTYVALVGAVFEAFKNDSGFYALMNSASQTAVAAAGAAAAATATGGITTFLSAASTWLSTVTKTV